jgi:hypothetical protein
MRLVVLTLAFPDDDLEGPRRYVLALCIRYQDLRSTQQDCSANSQAAKQLVTSVYPSTSVMQPFSSDVRRFSRSAVTLLRLQIAQTVRADQTVASLGLQVLVVRVELHLRSQLLSKRNKHDGSSVSKQAWEKVAHLVLLVHFLQLGAATSTTNI